MTPAEVRTLMGSLTGPTELVETHISYVILHESVVYKLKKPVHFSFLDFSTLAQRAHFCKRELELNRRLEPDVYLEVLPVCAAANGFRLGRAGETCAEVVDHALKMRRLDTRMEMDLRLGRGEIDAAFLEKLAAKVARFHAGATVIHLAAQSNPASYKADFDDLLGQMTVFQQVLGAESEQRLLQVAAASTHYLDTHANLIARRLHGGFVRDVHGDLHTRNIFAYPEPIIFDCIEFNDHFRQIDVLNEVAFLCMDLEANGFEDLSKTFSEAYNRHFPAMAGRGEELLFVWFKCYRANIRAKVNALGAAQPGNETAAKAEMERYLALMERYATILRASPSE